MKIYLLRIIVSIIVTIYFFGCDSNNIIPKHSELTNVEYSTFMDLLNTAKLDENYFDEGIQLANLKQKPKDVFSKINLGIKQYPKKSCEQIYPAHRVFKEINHMTNLVKIDTSEFFISLQLCFSLLGEESYDLFFEQKLEEKRIRDGNRPKLDSSKFYIELISQIDKIDKDDQRHRLKLDNPKYTKVEQEKAWEMQKELDSLNLIRVEKIINEFGWPSPEIVGYDASIIIWYVLHHQRNVSVRNKYELMVEQNMSEGAFNAYKNRSIKFRKEDKLRKH